MRTKRMITLGIVLLFLVPFLMGMGDQPTGPKNKYPIILAHGWSGFDSLAGLPYFYRIERVLENNNFDVHITEVSAYNSIEVRGIQLADQVEEILAMTGARKVHLVGHSMGGLDSRYATANRLGRRKVATVTTIATPHHGSNIADVIYPAVKAGSYVPGLNAFVSAIGGTIINGRINLPQDVYTSVWNLTNEFMDGTRRTPGFNDYTPNVRGVKYFSYTGTSVVNLGIDPSDAILFAMSAFFPFEKNDGLVSQSSARWGTVIDDDLNANHLDEINHLLGDTGVFYHAPSMYIELAEMLLYYE